MKQKLLLLLIAVFVSLQGCMTVSMRTSPPQSACLQEIKYSIPDICLEYDLILKIAVKEKNSPLENGLRAYKDSNRYFLASRESLEAADTKNLIGIIVQAAGGALILIPQFIAPSAISRDVVNGCLYAGAGVFTAGLSFRVWSFFDSADSRQKLKKSIDLYNKNCGGNSKR